MTRDKKTGDETETDTPGKQAGLLRIVGFPLLALYGIGTTIGAGIYVLTGAVAGVAGALAPWSFLLAGITVAFSAFSFAELGARFPESAGEAAFVREGFGKKPLSLAVGLAVAAAGMVSSATIINGFVGYFGDFILLPGWLTIMIITCVLFAVAAWGIGESLTVAALITVLECGGLLIIIAFGLDDAWKAFPSQMTSFIPDNSLPEWSGILAGGILAFYAFIGFEDMVNVAEEVRDPSRTVPKAIIATLIATLILYIAVSVISVLAVPPAELAASPAPLRLVFETVSGLDGRYLSAVAIVAVLNGALIQIIMAARVFYGLSDRGHLPAIFSRVNPITRTPLYSTALAGILILVAALSFPLVTLAKVTTFLTLAIFTTVNIALIRIKKKGPPPPGAPDLPHWVPYAGAMISTLMALLEILRNL